MSTERLGTLASGMVGVGLLVAVAISLSWFPVTLENGPDFWDNATVFFSFIRDNALAWRAFHVATNIGLIGLIILIPLVSLLYDADDKWLAMTAVGLIGTLLLLLASLMDQYATPVLARYATGNSFVPEQIWRTMEVWRDNGLKTTSFWLLGIWAVWLGGRLLFDNAPYLGQYTRIVGFALLLLAAIETLVPVPLVYSVGETGVGGLVLLLLPVWGFAMARWFWLQELQKNGST